MSAFFVGLGVFGLTVSTFVFALAMYGGVKAMRAGDKEDLETAKGVSAAAVFLGVFCAAMILGALGARAL